MGQRDSARDRSRGLPVERDATDPYVRSLSILVHPYEPWDVSRGGVGDRLSSNAAGRSHGVIMTQESYEDGAEQRQCDLTTTKLASV